MNLHMWCASIYQLIHCDVARHANEICNRLKPTAAFTFFCCIFLTLTLSPPNWVQCITNGKESNVNFTIATNCFHFAFACRVKPLTLPIFVRPDERCLLFFALILFCEYGFAHHFSSFALVDILKSIALYNISLERGKFMQTIEIHFKNV